jgi:hypothetical protein
MSKFVIHFSQETQDYVLSRKFDAKHPGAMSGKEILAEADDFDELLAVIHDFQKRYEGREAV